ncbi:MAG TPA: tRNA uridine-5-carboxymethylaminomethyl(34) synthesis GTPase MnmE [Vicinamibacterales bacterium]|nr:tRNA uridine-5-carboxymethylaminomethyl(34) synthesis GTPase MnmE [Vicinamibacterales bacterium]
MFSTADTIVAIATPAGHGGIGIVRLSGPEAGGIAQRLLDRPAPLAPRHATFARAVAADDRSAGEPRRRPIDQVVATFFPHPASYTGEDVVEISAHGSPVVLRQIVEAAVAAGARLAEPGEFTLRAFLNGRLDLVQAEAVADLIEAVTPRQARAAFDQLDGTLTREIGGIDERLFDLIARLEASLDFPDEGYHFIEPEALAGELETLAGRIAALLKSARQGRLIREGLQVVILGKPNVGKSTLFNALVGAGRAIVAEQPGTTRDLVTEQVEIEGLKVRLVDTAGIRESEDDVEAEGVRRAREAAGVADLTLVVLDVSRPLDAEDLVLANLGQKSNKLFIINKIDNNKSWDPAAVATLREQRQTTLSLRTGQGMDRLRPAIAEALDASDQDEDRVQVTNARHIETLRRAEASLKAARDAVGVAGLAEEFVLNDLHEARAALEEVRGRRAPDELLRHIFGRFCIGK